MPECQWWLLRRRGGAGGAGVGLHLRCEKLERPSKEGVLGWRMEGESGAIHSGVHRASEPCRDLATGIQISQAVIKVYLVHSYFCAV